MTSIFKNYLAFLNREDYKENGVSQSFADNNPTWRQMNEENEACWNCSDCRDCRGCSGCRDCSDCSDCNGLKWVDNKDANGVTEPAEASENVATFAGLKIPILENIHQKIYDAVTPPEHKLKMDAWHTCGTTHCRAGWTVHLTGPEGYALEEIGGTCFAAMMIYKYSSPNIRVSPVRFFEDNETALRDIKKCAESEKKKEEA